MAIVNILISILFLIFTFIYWFYKKSFSYWKSKGVPYIEPIFPYGNIKGMGKNIQLGQFTQKFYEKFKNIDKFCGMYFFAQPVILLIDLDLIKQILVKNFNMFNDRGLYHNEKDDPLSGHLVTLTGKKWKKIRTQLTPTFTSGKMKFMFPTIVEVSNRFVQHLRDTIKKNNELEMKDILARFTIDVIGTVAFGIECNSVNDPNSEFRQMGRTAIEKPRYNQRFSLFINTMPRLARFLRIKQIRDDVSEFFLNVVRSTIDFREANNIERNDFMDLLIKLKIEEENENSNGLTFNEIAAQVFVFFVAGFETSSVTMIYALYELALNAEIQKNARQVIRNSLNKHNGELTYEAMMDMPYIDQVINETLRKYPPFAALRRIAQQNYKIPNSDRIIEKGTAIVVPVYAIHHDPDYFPNPHKFDPERFSIEEIKKRNNMTWLAFGDGPRNCIGLRFAMMQIRIGLITLLNSFEFTVCSKTTIPIEFAPSRLILSPKDGLYF